MKLGDGPPRMPASAPGQDSSETADLVAVLAPRKWWMKVVLLAALYFAAGLAATLLVPSHTFASPIWPAAGVALAALLMCGVRCWPGVWLGAFLIDLMQSVSAPGALSAAAGGVGAALQAVVGAALVRRLLPDLPQMARSRDLARFLFLIGPLACVVAPTVGVWSRVGLGLAPIDVAGGEWLAWWAGDTLGVLLFAPAMLLLAWRERPAWARGAGALRIVLPLFVTAALLVTANHAMVNVGHRRMEAENARRMTEAYEIGVLPAAGALASLRWVERAISASDHVTPTEFARYTAWITLQPATLAIDWAPRVPHAVRAQFEADVAAQVAPGYRIVEPDDAGRLHAAPERAEYFPVLYSEPSSTNAGILGLDHAFEPMRRVEMEHATSMDGVHVAPLVPLVRTPVPAFLAFLPVFGAASEAGRIEAGPERREVRGFVVGSFDVAHLFAPLVEAARERALAFRISDATPGATRRVLLEEMPRGTAAQWSRDVDFGGRTLRLELVSAQAGFDANQSGELKLFEGLAVLAAFLIAFVALSTATHAAAPRREGEVPVGVPERDAQDADPAGNSAPRAIAEGCTRGRPILVAEDDPVNRKVILKQLSMLGYAADAAEDGERALQMWRAGAYAMLLTDLHMPRMDGYALARCIRAEEEKDGLRRTPILALSGNAPEGGAPDGGEGIDAYLSKPLRLDVLRDTLQRWYSND